MNKRLRHLGWLLAPLTVTAHAVPFNETVQNALISNPEIQARFHTWQAAKEEREAATGALRPRADLTAGVTGDRRDDPLIRRSYNQNQASLTLTQLLYDGFAVENNVSRLGHAALVRFFELRDTSENTALEIVRAYADVMKFRTLVALAEDNYVRHKSLFELIQSKVKAGVGRRVDLETASGRLALAEANLLTETSNLHDVSARFQRLTGVNPGAELGAIPPLEPSLPDDILKAVDLAVTQHPSLWAAYENIRATESAAKGSNAAFRPRLDFQVRTTHGSDVGGYDGNHRSHSAGLVLNWNLFAGGADRARTRQLAEEINAARDQFDRACRDVRQTLSVAFNDTRRLVEQIRHFDQHQRATEKTREAFRNQFDIGQRSLLDLLDTENELFQARRSYTNAVHDLTVANARVIASTGSLIPALGLTARGTEEMQQYAKQNNGNDFSVRCQALAPVAYTLDMSALDAKAAQMSAQSASAAAAARPAAAPSQSVAPVPASQPKPAPAAAAPSSDAQAVQEVVAAWANSWNPQAMDAYFALYANDFKPANGQSRSAWEQKRRQTTIKNGRVRVTAPEPVIRVDGNRATASFRQSYTSDRFNGSVNKTLTLAKQGGAWKIVQESN